MSEEIIIGLAAIIVLGVLGQWLAWRLKLPSILLLLVFGLIAGPISGLLRPDQLLGDMLVPVVSLSVAIILFEGGLSLKLSELREVGRPVISLVTIGILITWILASLSAWALVGLSLPVALLLGAILVVSGPTVVMPLLRQVRPTAKVGAVAKWEGIVNDPLGAVLAVLVFEVLLATSIGEGTSLVVFGVIKAILAGSLIGFVASWILIILIKRYVIPDGLQNPFALMLLLMAYITANHVQTEAGLLAVTVMGVVLANQKQISIRHIIEFKENLRVLLLSVLFIVLAARLTNAGDVFANVYGWIFVLILVLIVRPVATFASTHTSDLAQKEKWFLSFIAPRGVVAAAISSVFAIRLTEAGYAEANALIPLTFQVIIGTVAIYGLGAKQVARQLKVAQREPQGVLFAGASFWVRDLALILKEEGFEVALVDSNWSNVTQARQNGLRAHLGSILSEQLSEGLRLDGIGRLAAVTPNSEINSLAVVHFSHEFDSAELFQLSPGDSPSKKGAEKVARHLQGRYLFHEEASYEYLGRRLYAGAIIKRSQITETFNFDAYRKMYGENAIPLILITKNRKLTVMSTDTEIEPQPGDIIIGLVNEPKVDPATKDKRAEADL